MQSLTIIAEVADGIGMFGFAVAGLFASAGRRIDPVGVFVSVFTTAFGGGIIRDILLDLRPFYSCKSSKDHSKPRNEVDTSLKSPV